MEINLAKSSGFCFGVKRALEIAFRAADKGKNIYMLNDIVHNEKVVEKIKKSGIKKIRNLGSCVTDKTIIISAHGAPAATFQAARKAGYRIIDATCPMVKGIHNIARRMEKLGYTIIIIGDKRHSEVKGITGQLDKSALIIDEIRLAKKQKLKKIKKAVIVTQSTQDIAKVKKIVRLIKRCVPQVKFFNTICRPTRIKQEEIRKIPRKNDAVIVIGSKKSANTKRLFEIARSINPNSYWVNSGRELVSGWFRDVKSVGITAGASTPEETIREICAAIKKLAPSQKTDKVFGLRLPAKRRKEPE